MAGTLKVEMTAFDGITSTEEIKRLRSTHEVWNKYAPLWNFYLSAYEGGTSFTHSANLFKHTREHEEDFKDRAKRIHNINYCEPLVDFFTNFIFSESIERTGGPDQEFFKLFCDDVNRKGDTIDDFSRQVCDDMQIFGMSYIVVDAPQPPDGVEVLTKYQQDQYSIGPYWVLVKPDEILDWVIDEFNVYSYVKRRQLVTVMIGKKRTSIERYTEFYIDEYIISEVDVSDPSKPKLLGAPIHVPNTMGLIPIVVARYKRSKEEPYVGLSFLRDFAGNQREIMNLTSLLQEFLYRQAFNILAMEVDSVVPTVDQNEGEVGTANALAVPKGAQMPQYISPPAEPARFISEERARIKNEMFVRAAQDALSELFNGEKSSGFSQAQSFSKTVPFIASRADVLESVEHQLMYLTMKMLGKAWSGKIKYKDNYSITNLTDGITQFMMLVKDLQLPSETFVKEELKRMVHEFDGKLSPDILNKVTKEIDSMDFAKWAKTQKESLVGKQGASPGEQQKDKSTGTMAEAAAEAKIVNTGAAKKLKGS